MTIKAHCVLLADVIGHASGNQADVGFGYGRGLEVVILTRIHAFLTLTLGEPSVLNCAISGWASA